MNHMNIFEKFSQFLELKIGPMAASFANQKHILAVRNGVIAAVPLTIVGGISLIMAFPPIDPTRVNDNPNIFTQMLLVWHSWASANMATILAPFNMTMGIMALFVAMAVGYNLSISYKMNPLSGAMTAAATFLLVAAPSQSVVVLSKINDTMGYPLISKLGQDALPLKFMDAKGMFTAILVGLLVVEIARWLKKKNIVIKMPKGVPPAVASSFELLIPLIICVFGFHLISLLCESTFGMLIPEAIMKSLAPFVGAVDSAGGTFVIATMMNLLWFIGLHGPAIIGGVSRPFLDSNLLANASDKIAGLPLEHIYTTPFQDFYMQLGGSGATLALVFMLLWSKSKQLKGIGRIGLLPGLFNINEPIIFGLPLIFNPILFLPFVFVQGINGVIAYTVTEMGLVGATFVTAPWTTPAPIGAFLSTMDWHAAALILCLIVIDFVIYYPFFKIYEKQCIKQEAESSNDVNK